MCSIPVIRLVQIYYVFLRYIFNRSVLQGQAWWLVIISYLNPLSFLKKLETRGVAIRLGLITLGPIFVKFGQVLSTRQDLLPLDIVNELAQLQDRVPPFSSQKAIKIIEAALSQPVNDVFSSFHERPLASASIAQVHAAQLIRGDQVVVKVLRPDVKKVIRRDIALLYLLARLARRFWSYGKRLRPVELVAEFEEVILNELDLVREAANASQLRRNFLHSDAMYVPKVYWSYTRSQVMVMERVYGVPIADTKTLKMRQTNMKKLAERGVTVFFTQVFRDSFFHADMHPGNLFVDVTDPENPKYVGVDFGIVGSLSPQDQHYLAENILAFFRRDYRRIALLHIESGWVSADTRVDQFESAIRTVSEPIFEKPLVDISFGQLLLKLFQTAERYEMVIQPQLLLLQKTLFNVEGLGRRLYRELDLWKTAKPFMEAWSTQRKGFKKVIGGMKEEWEDWMNSIIKTPRLFYECLYQMRERYRREVVTQDLPSRSKAPRYFILGAGLTLLTSSLVAFVMRYFSVPTIWGWSIATAGGLLLLIALLKR